jgi:hypothetical protein
MIKPTKKQNFLLKIVLGTIIASEAGVLLALHTDFVFLGGFTPGFIYTFFPLACIVIMQWILLSDYLPEWWLVTGFIGCVISATLVGVIHFFVPLELYSSYSKELNALNAFIAGILVALPQCFILRNKRGYLWVLANGVGHLISVIYGRAIFYPMVGEVVALSFARTLILETALIPIGLMLGLYLYSYVYNSNHPQSIEDRNSQSKQNSPHQLHEPEQENART